jgi:hypothetical protein
MSENQDDLQQNKEYRILKAMKLVLTDVVKDTATQPGLKHPLSARTIAGIRECLKLIVARERELLEAAGQSLDMRPYFIDEPKKDVVVPITRIGRKKEDTDEK